MSNCYSSNKLDKYASLFVDVLALLSHAAYTLAIKDTLNAQLDTTSINAFLPEAFTPKSLLGAGVGRIKASCALILCRFQHTTRLLLAMKIVL